MDGRGGGARSTHLCLPAVVLFLAVLSPATLKSFMTKHIANTGDPAFSLKMVFGPLQEGGVKLRSGGVLFSKRLKVKEIQAMIGASEKASTNVGKID